MFSRSFISAAQQIQRA